MAKKTTETTGLAQLPKSDIYKPEVNISLSVTEETLVTMGVVRLKNALHAQLRALLKEVDGHDAEIRRLQARITEVVEAVDEPDFRAAAIACCDTIRGHFHLGGEGLPTGEEPQLTTHLRFVAYTKAQSRTLAAEIAYRSPDGASKATISLTRTYPVPLEVSDAEREIADLTTERTRVDGEARRRRVQLADNAGLYEQVRADLGGELLAHAGEQGQMLRAALIGTADETENPIRALLHERA